MAMSNAERQQRYRDRKKRQKRNAKTLRRNQFIKAESRPALRYFGSKHKLADWIISHFPPHVTYVEPFCGAANVLLQKHPTSIEVMNDLDSNVINFFDVLRTYPDDLINTVQLTPYSRKEHTRAWEPVNDPIEQARRFYVRIWQSIGETNSTAAHASWKAEKNNKRGTTQLKLFYDTDHLWSIAGRLRQVYIEHDDALKIIPRYDSPETLFYCDPPYLRDTRMPNAYEHELQTVADHEQLAQCLQAVEGMVILSGMESDLYRELYPDWTMVTYETNDRNRQQKTECLWLSPKTIELNRLPLFAERTG